MPPNSAKQLSPAGFNFLKNFEAYRQFPYDDKTKKRLFLGQKAKGYPTVGYGHVIRPGESFWNGLSVAEAEALLRRDLSRFEQAVRMYVTVELTQNQYDALVIFAFNVGIAANKTSFVTSSLLKLVNAGQFDKAADQFVRHHLLPNGSFDIAHAVGWIYTCGAKSLGLIRRRNAERNIFTKGEYKLASLIPNMIRNFFQRGSNDDSNVC